MTYDDFDTQIQCDEFAPEHGMDDFDDDLDLDFDVQLPDDDDILLFDEDGGLTADAYAMLSLMDDNGEFAS